MAADVAALIRKLCLEYLDGSMPGVDKALFTAVMRNGLVSVVPSENCSNGPER